MLQSHIITFITNMLQRTANGAPSHVFICIKAADIIGGMGCWGEVNVFYYTKLWLGVEGKGECVMKRKFHSIIK